MDPKSGLFLVRVPILIGKMGLGSKKKGGGPKAGGTAVIPVARLWSPWRGCGPRGAAVVPVVRLWSPWHGCGRQRMGGTPWKTGGVGGGSKKGGSKFQKVNFFEKIGKFPAKRVLKNAKNRVFDEFPGFLHVF